MALEWYIYALDESLELVAPYISRIPKGEASLPPSS